MLSQETPVFFGADRRYRCLRELALGGMAELFVAVATREAGFEKLVVVKRVLPHLARDEEFVSMFLDEARLAATLDHPNIAQVMDFGRDGDTYYYVMEYIQGMDVRELLKRPRGPLPLPVALSIIAAACSGLHYAHERTGRDGAPLHLVHRDVSPSNIFVSIDGAVKLLDFGIAKAATAAVVTASGVLKGKLGYMSPEQCRGDVLDRRSDVFGLGVVLYQLVTGRRPFATGNYFGALNDIQKGRFSPPSEFAADVPPQIESIILRAMSGDPDDRHPTAAAFGEAIEEFALEHRVRLSDSVLRDHMSPFKGEIADPRGVSVRTGATEVASIESSTAIIPTGSADVTVGGDSEAWTKNRIQRFRRRTTLAIAIGLPAALAAGWMVRAQRADQGKSTAPAAAGNPELPGPEETQDAGASQAQDPPEPAPAVVAQPVPDTPPTSETAETHKTPEKPSSATRKRKKRHSKPKTSETESEDPPSAKSRLGPLAPPG